MTRECCQTVMGTAYQDLSTGVPTVERHKWRDDAIPRSLAIYGVLLPAAMIDSHNQLPCRSAPLSIAKAKGEPKNGSPAHG
jgi:hypothetical protein